MNIQTRNIFKKFGCQLIKRGSAIVRSAFQLKPASFTNTTMRNFLSERTGLNRETISLSDAKYYIIDWEKWEQIIGLDMIDELIYETDVMDCDNFAFLFTARAANVYRINSAGVAFGGIYNKDTGKYIGRHAFNMITTIDNGIMNVRVYEPMNDLSSLVVKGQPIIIGTWEYRPTWILMI